MFGYNAMQFVGSVVTGIICMALLIWASRNSKLSARQRVVLLIVIPLMLFVVMGDDCDDTSSYQAAGNNTTNVGAEIGESIDKALDDANFPDSSDVRKAIGMGQ